MILPHNPQLLVAGDEYNRVILPFFIPLSIKGQISVVTKAAAHRAEALEARIYSTLCCGCEGVASWLG